MCDVKSNNNNTKNENNTLRVENFEIYTKNQIISTTGSKAACMAI